MDQKDKELIEKIKQLPKIKDQQDKALLFNKIDQNMKGVTPMKKRNRAKWLVPSIATAAILILGFIMIQTGILNQDQTSEQSSDLETRSFDMEESDSLDEGIFSTAEEEDLNGEEVDEAEILIEDTEEDDVPQPDPGLDTQLVYYQDEHQFPIYNMAVLDLQAMFAIPISLVDTATTPDVDYPNDVYNRISTMIDADQFGVEHFPFDDIEFIFSESREQITMAVADDYQFPAGSSLASLFSTIINFMFADYPATELNLETESTDSIDLGPIGEESSLELEPINHMAYKIYQYDDNERLLVPLTQPESSESFFTVDEALLEMQYDQLDFNVSATIPVDAEYTVDPSDEDILNINFEADSQFADDQETKEMIEAILMTAKSFGFNHVEFDLGDDLTEVNQFDLTEPVPVPDAANPLLLH